MMQSRVLIYIIWSCLAISTSAVFSSSIIITEFLCNPDDGLETEWIELYNPTLSAVDLEQMQIGDELGLRRISDTTLLLQPEEYLILAQDVDYFLEFYSGFSAKACSPLGWQILNNDGDIVRLSDDLGNTIDSVAYDNAFSANRSWERYVNAEGRSFWGASFATFGSTPGEVNTFIYPRVGNIDLSVTPDPFSPDGDGFEDETVIKYDMPEAEAFELTIYNISGKKIKTLCESMATIPGEVIWDGYDDDGRRCPVGIYILYAHLDGDNPISTKRTVVIAR